MIDKEKTRITALKKLIFGYENLVSGYSLLALSGDMSNLDRQYYETQISIYQKKLVKTRSELEKEFINESW